MESISTYLALICLASVIIAWNVWSFSRGRALLKRWAQENGFQIVHSEFSGFYSGSFTWTSSRSQIIYFVQVLDSNGKERSGWVRCGSFWSGIVSDKTEVKWKDES
jgi:hypothetical protein